MPQRIAAFLLRQAELAGEPASFALLCTDGLSAYATLAAAVGAGTAPSTRQRTIG